MPFRLALRKYWWLLRRILVDPLASLVLLGYDREEELIERLHARFSGGLSASLRGAELPLDLRRLTVSVRSYKTHKRTVRFTYGSEGCSAETSDLVFLVDYKLNGSLYSRRLSLVQLKLLDHGGSWSIKCNQYVLMRYWPPFSFGGGNFDPQALRSCVGSSSFYLLGVRREHWGELHPLTAMCGLIIPTPLLEHSSSKRCATCSDSFSIKFDSVRDLLRCEFSFRRFLVNAAFQDCGAFDPDYFKYVNKAFYLSDFDEDPLEPKEPKAPSVLIRLEVSLSRE